MAEIREEVFIIQSKIRGYHIYKQIWEASVGERLRCKKEENNAHDPYCVGVIDRSDKTVGHVPREISAVCSLFLDHHGTISCEVIGHQQYSEDLPKGGLEIPCRLSFRGPARYLEKVRKLITSAITARLDSWCIKDSLTNDQEESVSIELDLECEDSGPDQLKPIGDRIWLELHGCHMLNSDRDTLMHNRRRLNDRHVNFAQKLLKLQFPCMDGLRLTLQQKKKQVKIVEGVQVMHCHGDHWIVVSSVGCVENEVHIFDSVYSAVNDDTRSVIHNLFGPEICTLTMMKMQKQDGPDDCGLFAIAVATSLVHGVDIGIFKQEAMRKHLLECFEKKVLCIFPTV